MRGRAERRRLFALAGVCALLFISAGAISSPQAPVAAPRSITGGEEAAAEAADGNGGKNTEPRPEMPPGTAARKKPLEIVFFYVGQGDSTLISTPGGKHLLVDGGSCRTKWSSYDAADYVIIPYLKEKGITKLDFVIGTHPDLDHIGGLVTLLKDRDFDVGCYIDPGKTHTTRYYRDLLELVKDRTIPYRMGRAGQKLKLGDGIDAEIVSPSSLSDDNNESSIVLRLKYGKASFLLTGDAGERAESDMRSRYGHRLRTTVLKAGHHGSRSSSSRSFLSYVKPRMAVISCGKRSKFGHPHEEVLDRLKAVGAKILRTDELGTFTIRTDGRTIKVVKKKAGG